jgi:uncharacterized membrane protein
MFRFQPPAPVPHRRTGPLPLALGTALCLLALASPAVSAATRVEVTTPYPAVAVEPASTATFPLTVTADTRERVDLSVTGVPEGWSADFRGGGFTVDGVFADPAAAPELDLAVDVPGDAAQGTYRIVVTATATGASDTLQLDMRVAEAAAGDLELTTDFPELQGATDATFRFDLQLRNDTPQDITANLSGEGPPGWQVDARPSSQEQAASATVEAGSSTSVVVEVDPPNDVAAGEYPVTVRAAGGARSAETQLMITITGDFGIELTTADERLNAQVTAGASREITLRVINSGTAPLQAVELSATAPTDWSVSFTQEGGAASETSTTIAEIAPQESVPVTATITPAGEAIAGDYVVSFTASTPETNADADIRVTVETSTIWAIVGGLLIVGTLLGLAWVFRTYGRR